MSQLWGGRKSRLEGPLENSREVSLTTYLSKVISEDTKTADLVALLRSVVGGQQGSSQGKAPWAQGGWGGLMAVLMRGADG